MLAYSLMNLTVSNNGTYTESGQQTILHTAQQTARLGTDAQEKQEVFLFLAKMGATASDLLGNISCDAAHI